MSEHEFTVVMYKDFDGVTNAPHPTHQDTVVVDVEILNHPNLRNPSKVVYSPHVVKVLDRLRNDYKVELVWGTTWNHNDTILAVPTLIGGLSGGRVLPANLNQKAANKKEWTQWKAEAIIEDQRLNPRPFIWLDDNAHTYWGDFVKDHTTAPSLFITPSSKTGLTLDDLNDIEFFLIGVGDN